MQRLTMAAGDDKAMLRSLAHISSCKILGNSTRIRWDGCHTASRAFEREVFAMFQAKQDTTSEEDLGSIAEDDSGQDSEDSDETGEEAGGMVTDDDGSVGESNTKTSYIEFNRDYEHSSSYSTGGHAEM
jgi:hypothetical protein